VVTPAGRKLVAAHLISAFQISQRRACQLAGISRTGLRYQAVPAGDEALRRRLKELAAKHNALGCPMLHGMLRSERLVINHKRTERLYIEEGLQLRKRRKKKLDRPRMPLVVPTACNIRWSMDFVSDQLSNGRRFRVLNVKDDHSKELVGQLTAYSISGAMVGRFLDQLIAERSAPNQITCDNGTEFTSKAMFFWQKSSGVKLAFIQPGKPTQNAFVESLNGRFRAECLNQHWFRSLEEAQEIIDAWRHHYNHERPHSTLSYMTPVAFAKRAA
jgi:putative transposase